MTSTYLGVGAGTGQKSTYFSPGPSGGGGSNAFGGGDGRKPAAAGVSVYLGMPSGGAGAATSDYFDNIKTANGGIPMDNTKTAIGGIPMDPCKAVRLDLVSQPGDGGQPAPGVSVYFAPK